MITIVDKVPAKYERIVLEEYYTFYQYQNGERDIFNKNIKFTTDENKLTEKELANKSLIDSIKTLKDSNPAIKFLLSFDLDDRLVAVTRLYSNGKYLHICDIVYPNYPDVAEKLMLLNEIIEKSEEIARNNDQDLDFEIQNNDEATLSFAGAWGFKQLNEEKREFTTVVLTKKVEKRDKNEQTLSRKQNPKFN